MRKDPDEIFPPRSRRPVVLAIAWLAGLVLLASLGGLFPESDLIQRYFNGPHGLFRIMWVVAYLGITWFVLSSRRR